MDSFNDKDGLNGDFSDLVMADSGKLLPQMIVFSMKDWDEARIYSENMVLLLFREQKYFWESHSGRFYIRESIEYLSSHKQYFIDSFETLIFVYLMMNQLGVVELLILGLLISICSCSHMNIRQRLFI